ncbi:hypothetical protein V1477_003926 [Vespula maculifrons]|uniref:Uncharacterized protein n=1 Tax=Vespula maculifrons TaxID=7453 RepID=A0ABD2CSC5_VESMC
MASYYDNEHNVFHHDDHIYHLFQDFYGPNYDYGFHVLDFVDPNHMVVYVVYCTMDLQLVKYVNSHK